MAKRIAFFNNKGGVSKTTTTFHVAWMLAEKGYRVIMVDTDPQCNLSGLVLGFSGENEFENYYSETKTGIGNIRDGLIPAFESQPRMLQPVECVQVRDGLFLLPGHIRLAEYEVTLGIAQEMSGSITSLQNIPGAISYLLESTAEKYNADYVLIDMSPSLGSINQNVLMTSDYFIIPASPDYFCVMAIESLSNVLPRWKKFSDSLMNNHALASAVYKYPEKAPKLLGTVIQKYRPRAGKATVGFQQWIDQINKRVEESLVPALQSCGMVFPSGSEQCLAQIADFNTLIAKSQEFRKPVFALDDVELGHAGKVLNQDRAKMSDFKRSFSDLADSVVTLAI